jgi:two-component system chemotaxis response regulator CheB
MMEKMTYKAIAIGASAGALEALSSLLPALPAGYPLSIFVVVHLPSDKDSGLAQLLQYKCPLKVCEAEDKEPIESGTVYIAPPDYHLLIEKNNRLSLSSDEPVLYSRPSIDVMFESAADVYGDGLIGVVLTGANADGSKGLKAIADAGGLALVQDPKTAYSGTMPEQALKLCPSARALTLDTMASYLKDVGHA